MRKRLKSRLSVDEMIDGRPDHDLVGVVRIPEGGHGPWYSLAQRLFVAFLALFAASIIVYLDGDGYVDNNQPGTSLSMLDAVYYATVSLSTTGYGDIVPATDHARLINILIITPLRLFFLIVLVGSTISVLTERSRQSIKIQRWRRNMKNHTVVAGYGTKGRSAVAALLADDVPPSDIVVVDIDPLALEAAAAKGLVTVRGSATKSDVLRLAGVPRAKSVVVATNLDDTAVLVTLTTRELAPRATVVASIRESENAHLLKQSGADSVVVSAETTGRMLGMATVAPSLVEMMEDLLSPDEGFSIAERLAEPKEVGGSPRHLSDIVLGVVRRGSLLRVSSPEADTIESGDRLLYIRREPEE